MILDILNPKALTSEDKVRWKKMIDDMGKEAAFAIFFAECMEILFPEKGRAMYFKEKYEIAPRWGTKIYKFRLGFEDCYFWIDFKEDLVDLHRVETLKDKYGFRGFPKEKGIRWSWYEIPSDWDPQKFYEKQKKRSRKIYSYIEGNHPLEHHRARISFYGINKSEGKKIINLSKRRFNKVFYHVEECDSEEIKQLIQ